MSEISQAPHTADGIVHLTDRAIPLPVSISPAAQAYLSAHPQQHRVFPHPGDLDGWRANIAAFDASFLPWLREKAAGADATVVDEEIAGVRVARAVPRVVRGHAERLVLHLHGGALIYGGGMAAFWALLETMRAGCTVIAVDYRMPPDHPYPAGVDDVVAVYRQLVARQDARRIAISGASAGAHFAAAAALRIRAEALPPPGAVMLMTPEVDLTESGDTFRTNADIDVVLKRGLGEANALYAAGHDLADPKLSPIFADFRRGFPPTFIQSGTRDLFLSNAVRMHRALRRHGLPAELHVWEAMPHGGFGLDTPEDADVDVEYRRFLDRYLG